MRVLRYNNICIDESRNISTAASAPGGMHPETHVLDSVDMVRDADALVAAHSAFMEAKAAYTRAVEQFWNSAAGVKCQAILAPDPLTLDRTLLSAKLRDLDARIASQALGGIRHKSVEYTGYDRITAKYVFTMYEVQEPPRFFNDFVLQTWNECVIDTVPNVWTNKMALERKKEVELVYVYGHIEPPYRRADVVAMSASN